MPDFVTPAQLVDIAEIRRRAGFWGRFLVTAERTATLLDSGIVKVLKAAE